MEVPAAFNATSSNRSFRIYIKGHDLFFICVTGSLGATVEALTTPFGPIGSLLGLLARAGEKKKAASTIQRLDQVDPELLLAEHRYSFKLYAAEIRHAMIDLPTVFGLRVGKGGRWKFSLLDGRTMGFQLENGDMKAALNLLPELLDSALQINVEWDEGKRRFQKK
jgi:hypothetical protein